MQNIEPTEIEKIFHKAELLRENGKREEALQEYTRVVFLAPRHWPAYFHLGTLFGATGKYELAVSLLRRAEELNSDNPVVKNNLAEYLDKLDRHDEAIEFFQQSWDLDSTVNNTSAAASIGRIYWESNRPKEAIPYFDMVLNNAKDQEVSKEIEGALHVSRWFRGLCKMCLGDYQAAWDDYESRVNIPGVINPDLSGEKWTGQSLDGKTIFFAYEQRFGDIIQFMRFIPLLNEMGARVLIQIPPELERLFSHSFPDVELVLTSEKIPEYDYHHLVTSVPAILNLTKKEATLYKTPYMDVVETDRVAAAPPMRGDSCLRVGLLWAGQPNPDRSIPITKYIPLLKHRSVSFYSFQLGERRQDLYDNAVGWLIHDLAPGIKDFYDSSILLKNMDLLITIDTAIAHQAGALGVPVWLMLRHVSDWRWELNREDNAWYSSMRLFRQESEGCWDEAAIKLERAFDKWVERSERQKNSGSKNT
jgi:tetratricopeptide (TPR) repeat protein